MSIEFLHTPFEKANYLATLLSSHATGGNADNNEYATLRQELLSLSDTAHVVPPFVRTNRDLSSFWNFIQPKFTLKRPVVIAILDEEASVLIFIDLITNKPFARDLFFHRFLFS